MFWLHRIPTISSCRACNSASFTASSGVISGENGHSFHAAQNTVDGEGVDMEGVSGAAPDATWRGCTTHWGCRPESRAYGDSGGGRLRKSDACPQSCPASVLHVMKLRTEQKICTGLISGKHVHTKPPNPPSESEPILHKIRPVPSRLRMKCLDSKIKMAAALAVASVATREKAEIFLILDEIKVYAAFAVASVATRYKAEKLLILDEMSAKRPAPRGVYGGRSNLRRRDSAIQRSEEDVTESSPRSTESYGETARHQALPHHAHASGPQTPLLEIPQVRIIIRAIIRQKVLTGEVIINHLWIIGLVQFSKSFLDNEGHNVSETTMRDNERIRTSFVVALSNTPMKSIVNVAVTQTGVKSRTRSKSSQSSMIQLPIVRANMKIVKWVVLIPDRQVRSQPLELTVTDPGPIRTFR
ncbi:hypothetical protein DFH08DRAFT_827035 [Mycena albidolilacea]|uniref:Uncharacterized protein n=1 Tax=Mycena albidolilacea TaxID=1033008 RepID=A0AAD7E7L8_9AGAR|nr:hypothetical protein DFH08DRAFT_827035 [Mycena albidolilacea]